jgi:unsaturated rhamnogalacturonyl hydrolase
MAMSIHFIALQLNLRILQRLMKHFKPALFLLLLLLMPCSLILNAQEDVPGRIPEYTIPYEYPTVDGIKEVLNRVRRYYESTCDLKIIDSRTDKEITDFTIPNKDARVSRGFAGSWDYTHGVVLSAFEYIDDVTGDPSFFANNTRFYDKVTETLPYFIKNREVFGKEARGGWGRTPDFHALDDCGSMGAAMIKTYLKDKNDDYLELINITADYISNRQFRLDDGTLARHRPQYHSIWVDDLYMSVPSSRRNCSAYCLKIMRAGTRFSTYIVQ